MGCILNANNIGFSYPDSTEYLFRNLSFSLNDNERLLITGPNGSGKTTILKLILGMLSVTEGNIKLRENLNIAYCKQDYPNPGFPISAEEVVKMGLYGNRNNEGLAAVRRAMERTGCLHLAGRLFSSLSGGERQRVSLARCFCQNADLLRLDEPSSFLDTDSRNTLVSILQNLEAGDFAVIAVTHDSAVSSALDWKRLETEAF